MNSAAASSVSSSSSSSVTEDANDIFSISGCTALVTGASSGLGSHFALFLAKQGANVVLAARREERLSALVDKINNLSTQVVEKPYGKARALILDVSLEESAVSGCIDEASLAFGRIDILINNAGNFRGGHCLNISFEEYNEVMNVNVRGVWLVAKLVAQKMAADGKGGRIVNISSITGHQLAIRGESVYGMSKAAVAACTRALARELGPLGIRVNAIAPGVFPTDMTVDTIQSEKSGKDCEQALPSKKWGDPNVDLMGVLLLLASEKASRYIHGQVITVDGGHCLITPDLEDFSPGLFL